MALKRILISFQRNSINKKTSDFLCSKLDKNEDSELITNITLLQTGLKKKLKAEESNTLMIRLLFAIMVDDDLEDSSLVEEIPKDTNVDTDTDNDGQQSEVEESEEEKTDDGDTTIKQR